jgi:hypothetical protein
MRAAHDRGYRYPEGFGGFEADLVLTHGSKTAGGRVRIGGPRAVELDLDAGEDELGWLRRELGSMVGHRWHLPYEQADGANTLMLGPDDGNPLGRFIDVLGDRFDSSYRVLDGEISQVNRAMGRVRFSIQIQARVDGPHGASLPAHFTVFYWDVVSGRLTRADIYRDVYETVDGIALPASRQIISAGDEGITTRRFELRGHRLLESDAVGGEQLEYRQH